MNNLFKIKIFQIQIICCQNGYVNFFIAVHQHQKRLFFIAVHQQLCSMYNTKRSIKGESCPFKKQKWAREKWTGEGRAENLDYRKNLTRGIKYGK